MATQMELHPSAYAWPVSPSSSHADSPVALSDSARNNPGIFLPPRTKSALVFDLLEAYTTIPTRTTR